MEEISIFDYIEDNHYRYKKVFPCDHRIRIFEAFAGIGCQRLGAEMLKVPYEVVGISEIDKYAIQSYMAMHGDTPNYGDITKMTYIPQCDIFTWSFPCTDLSKAGKRAGLDIGTRSGLVYEVLRLLKATEFKPKVLIMENVPDLVQETFKAQFYEIQKEIERYGYKNYTRVLNAKDYGVAQNRERVFMVSILGDDHYEFPIPFKLETRLKDYLEENVDEKYYLSDKILSFFKQNSIVNEEKGNGFRFKPKEKDEVANALTTRSGGRMDDNFIKEPVLIQVAQLDGKHEESGRVYSQDGLSPTINTCGGGNREPKIAETICLNSQVNGKQPSLQDRVYDIDGTSTAITTSFMPSIAIGVAQRGRNGKQQIELNNEELSNALTTVQKDSMILIPEATIKGYAEAHDGDGVYINRPEQKRGCVQKGMIQTLKTSCDDVGVVVDTYNKRILDNQNVVGTITSNTGTYGHCGNFSIINNLRIRKLTPLECWRLMGITDEYFDRASKVCSNSQLYKQAGNSLVVNVFALLLKGLIETE